MTAEVNLMVVLIIMLMVHNFALHRLSNVGVFQYSNVFINDYFNW